MKTYNTDSIIEQYDESSSFSEDYQRNRWGSQASMLNRMKLVLSFIPFGQKKNWLDIGCGSGVFQQLVSRSGYSIQSTGIDISTGMLEQARQKAVSNTRFIQADFQHYTEGCYDVITCLGVLQKTNFNLNQFFSNCDRLLTQEGTLFVSTKNRGWIEFNKPESKPCNVHQWFDKHEIENAMQQNSSLIIISAGGFLPAENLKVTLQESHDMYFIIGRKGG